MPIGQPTKCTPERQALVVQHLLDGLGQSEAARLAGIDPATHFRWMKKGEEGGDDDENIKAYRGYCQAVKRAIAQWEAESLRVIAEHAKPHGRDRGSWQAQAWLLERRMPDKYGRRTRVEQTGKDGGPIQVAGKGSVAVSLVGKGSEALEELLGHLDDEQV